MAKIKITESQLKMIAEHNALNESSEDNRSLIKFIWVNYFDEISNEINPSDFADEYDFAENFLSYMVEMAVSHNLISQEESDRTVEKMKDMYGERLIDMYGKPDNDEDEDEDEDYYGDDDVEPIDYTMGRHDDPNMMPNPPREINLDLNEGQLLLKKVFNQFK
jgi:hypothetical protein